MIAIFFTADAAAVSRGLARIDHTTIFGSYVVGFAARERAQLADARAAFGRVRASAGTQCPTLARLALYELGQVNLIDGRFADAAAQLASFVDTHTGRSFASFAAFQGGVAAVLAGGKARSEDAPRLFEAAVARARPHYSYDRYAARKAAEYLAVGAPTFFDNAAEKQLVLAELELRAHRFDEVVRRLAKVERLLRPEDGDRRALAAFYRGAAMRCLPRQAVPRADVEVVLREAVRTGAHATRERQARPHALVELAELAALAGDETAAARLLDDASAISTGYDFDLPLRRRILRDRDALASPSSSIPRYGIGIAIDEGQP
jgi:ATP/maltotriose-dependent transcriptional regulator MalT